MSYKKRLIVDILAQSDHVFSIAEEGVFVTELPRLKSQIFVFYHPDSDKVKIVLRYMAFIDKFQEVRLDFDVEQYKILDTLNFINDEIFPNVESGILASKMGSDQKAESSQYILSMKSIGMTRYFDEERQAVGFVDHIQPNIKQGEMTLFKLGKKNKAISTFTFHEGGYKHNILGK